MEEERVGGGGSFSAKGECVGMGVVCIRMYRRVELNPNRIRLGLQQSKRNPIGMSQKYPFWIGAIRFG